MDKHKGGRTRLGDYPTSVEGAHDVSRRAPNQRTRLLAAYYYSDEHGLTDEQAADVTGLLGACYWKRCGELRQDGFIELTGEFRTGASGVARVVSAITVRGKYAAINGEPV